MMSKIFQIRLIFYIYLFYLEIQTYYGKVISIRNGDESFRNFFNLINDIQNDKNGLIVKFEDAEYDMTEMGFNVGIYVNYDITFIGNSNVTIFDYKNERMGLFHFIYHQNSNITITIENIIFDNAGSEIANVDIFKINFNTNNNKIIFNNCIFRNNYLPILNLEENNNYNSLATFNHCNFL